MTGTPHHNIEQPETRTQLVPNGTHAISNSTDSRFLSILAQLDQRPSQQEQEERHSHTESVSPVYVDHFLTPISPDAYHKFFRKEGCKNNQLLAQQQEENHQPRSKSFPVRLYKMLEEASTYGFESIVSWQSHGRAFAIHDSKRLELEILPR